MNVTLQQTEKLLKSNQPFTQLGFSMMLTRLKSVYARDPSQTVLQNCFNEINTFLNKYQSVMTNDYTVISKL